MRKGTRIVYSNGHVYDRAIALGVLAHMDGCPFASTVTDAVRQQQAAKGSRRSIASAEQKVRTSDRAQAAREKRDNFPYLPLFQIQ